MGDLIDGDSTENNAGRNTRVRGEIEMNNHLPLVYLHHPVFRKQISKEFNSEQLTVKAHDKYKYEQIVFACAQHPRAWSTKITSSCS